MPHTTFETLRIIYQNNLCFASTTTFQNVIGASWDTVVSNQEDEVRLNSYLYALEVEMKKEVKKIGVPLVFELKKFVGIYVRTSRAYNGDLFEWRERKDIRQKRNFCLWLLSRVFEKNVENDAFNHDLNRKLDNDILNFIFPDGLAKHPIVDPLMLSLICFGVIEPISTSRNARARSLSKKQVDLRESGLNNYINAVSKIIPIVLSKSLTTESYCPYILYCILKKSYEITNSKNTNDLFKELADFPIDIFRINGIWQDNLNSNRFWIFPDNSPLLLCFECDGNSTRMFIYCIFLHKYPDGDTFLQVIYSSPYGINDGLQNKLRDPSIIDVLEKNRVILFYSIGGSSEISLSYVENEKLPSWWPNITTLNRVEPCSPLYSQFISRLESIFIKKGEFLEHFSDNFMGQKKVGNLVAMDGKFLYVSTDINQTDYEISWDRDNDEFYFDLKANETRSLLQLEISEYYPLYLIPRYPQISPQKSWERNIIESINATDMDNSVVLLQDNNTLFLNFEYGYSLELAPENMTKFGIIKLTKRQHFLF